jgi:cobalt-zinc-cadmium efflux system membrane fusion protein
MKIYIYTLLAISLLTACGPKQTKESKSAQEEVTQENTKTDNIIISKEQFKANHMLFGKPEMMDFPEYIEVTGMIDVPPQNKASISPVMGGYVHNFNLLEGDYVKKGQVLFSLKNPKFIQLQEEFLAIKNSLDYLKSDFERQKQLMEEQITSAKKYLKAKSEYQSALSRYHSLKKQLNLLNIDAKKLSPDNIHSIVYITSPLNGYISGINIEKGVYLEPAHVAMKVVNNKHKHIEMKVFEKDVQKLKIGQDIIFYQPDYADKNYGGEIHLIGKTIDPKQRSVNVHGHLKNEKEGSSLLPGMFVTAKIATDMHKAIVVPETAIVDEGEKHFVLVKEREENGKIFLIPVEVKIGKTWKNLVEIISPQDLSQETEVLVKGGYFLLGVGEGEE